MRAFIIAGALALAAVVACGPAHVYSPATVEQVEACDKATYYNDQFQECLRAMTRINHCGGQDVSTSDHRKGEKGPGDEITKRSPGTYSRYLVEPYA